MAASDDDEGMEMKSLPTLYKRNENGSIQQWSVHVDRSPEGHGCIIALYGKVDGKLQKAEEWIREGKNIGRANETTAIQQAEAEAQSQWEKKLKNKGYVQDIEDAKAGKVDETRVAGGISPMLAHKYAEQAHKIAWPAYVQPKLDGHRCIAVYQDGTCTLWSRQRKPITGLPHVCRAVESLCQRIGATSLILDGELYNHDYRHNFEDLTGFIRSATPKPGHEVVQYWVYDLPGAGGFAERAKILADLGSNMDSSKIVLVPTDTAEDEAQMIALFGVYLEAEFEGVMVRNAKGVYKNARSYDLQKVKVFQDAEFEIVDVVPGKGGMSDKGVFVCITEEGKTFKAKMVGPLAELKKYLDHKEDYIGKPLTVKFQKWSAEKVPVFGVAMRIREDV